MKEKGTHKQARYTTYRSSLHFHSAQKCSSSGHGCLLEVKIPKAFGSYPFIIHYDPERPLLIASRKKEKCAREPYSA